MQQVLGLQPFVPARDFALSKRFYQALGFAVTFENDQIAILKLDGFSFILQNYYQENCHFMMQLMVDDLDSWWKHIQALDLVITFGVESPRPPAMQPWGLRVGYVYDPSGVLWHVAERRENAPAD